jgi:hypothetical protein
MICDRRKECPVPSVPESDTGGRQPRTRREISDRIGGWPLTKRGNFDQQLIARLHAIEAPGDPCQFADPSYIFRRGQTNACHSQAFMQGPEDEGWYDRVQAGAFKLTGAFPPKVDFPGVRRYPYMGFVGRFLISAGQA